MLLLSERFSPLLAISSVLVFSVEAFCDESPDCLAEALEDDEPELDEFEAEEFEVDAPEDAELSFLELRAADDEPEVDWLPCMAGEVRLALSTGSSSSVQSLRGLSLSVMAHASSPCRPQPYCRHGDGPGHGPTGLCFNFKAARLAQWY